MDKKIKTAYSATIAAIWSVIFATIATIMSELSHGFKDWLAEVSGHHWTTKSIFTMLVFVVVFILVRLTKKNDVSSFELGRTIGRAILITILGTLAIVGFFVWHFYWT
jgi:hypothetical protein